MVQNQPGREPMWPEAHVVKSVMCESKAEGSNTVKSNMEDSTVINSMVEGKMFDRKAESKLASRVDESKMAKRKEAENKLPRQRP